ncbi:major paralogous domain-containing protein, partial [Fibrobacter sp. UWH9]|uniref:fibrobacter succinogenes major paralogous domain-containing protein n=1 Tax=Fibrobacter sp. UWH9 TaxID=1896213 RepID=UPI0009143C3D
ASEKCPNKFDYSNKNEKLDGYINFLQHQGICPDGWHVMNEDVWTLLSEMSGSDVAYYMGSMVTGFGSKNSYGLSILPAGYWQEEKFEHITESVGYYLPQQHKSQEDVAQAAYVNKNSFSRSGGALKTNALSIRCVKNY